MYTKYIIIQIKNDMQYLIKIIYNINNVLNQFILLTFST